MKRIVIYLLLVFWADAVAAQDRPEYAVTLIPDSLKKDVNAVVRNSTFNMVVKSPGKGRMEIKSAVTVLNEKAADELEFAQSFDKFHKIEDIEIRLYDDKGKYLRHFKRRDLEKAPGTDGFSLVTDMMVLYGEMSTDQYPVTIEINYAVVFEGILEYMDFFPQIPEQTIQQSSYTITTDINNKVRYKNYRCNITPIIRKDPNTITYVWSVNNVMPFKKEEGSAADDRPTVMISPTLFEMDDFGGDMSSWESFAKWQIALNKDATQLSDEKVAFFRDLVKNATSDREKAAILYKYLQENYRYVSIQLGIGGWKPFSADFVDKKKYGDCKALSNYMRAMLQAVNVRSHYAIINAGYDEMPVEKDFPQSNFNHVILCVPQPKDTIWLECTSRTQPFGVLGNFTENRNAFLITENGGAMVPTPKSKPADNVLHTNTLVTMNTEGGGTAKVDIQHKGRFTDILNSRLFESTDQVKKSYLINRVGYKQPDELLIEKRNVAGSNYLLHYDLSYEKIPDFSAGSKLFLNARLYKFWNSALPRMDKRETDYYMEFPFIQTDTTIFQLPEGYTTETLPKPASIKDVIGVYESNYSFDAGKHQLISTCSLTLYQNVIKASHYQEAAKFFSDVIREQQQKLVIKKE